MANGTSFFDELKRRNVYRVGIAYAIASWLLLQVIDVVDPIIGIPEWVPKLILVLLAVGLPLALIFAWAYEMTPEGLKREKDVDRSASITHETGQRLNRIIIGVLVIAVGVLLVDRSMFERSSQPTAEPAADAPVDAVPADEVVATAAPSIAVLPFANMSADESSTYFSDGLADTLLHMLAQIREIRVAARTSSFQFRDQNTDITRIAEALNVGTVLEGSVQRAGNKIRVTAQLIEANTGYHLWSGNYDRDLDDIFAIQDEIANEVVAALKVSLLGESAAQLSQHDTDNLEAYTEYLLGVNDLNQYSFESLPLAVSRFSNAVQLDPTYALAWATLGYTYLQMVEVGIGNRGDLLEKARDAASRAIDLDRNSSSAIAVLGTVEEQYGNLETAEQLYKRSIELGPNDTNARMQYVSFLMWSSRPLEAREHMLKALALDPLSTDVHNMLAVHYSVMNDYDEAQRYAIRLREINAASPVSYYREAEIEYGRGNFANAILMSMQALEADPDDPEIAMLIGDYYLSMDMPDHARDWYDRSVEIDPDHPVSRAAPLNLYIYNDSVSPDGVRLARRLLSENIENRHGSRARALQTLWIDAARNSTYDEALEFLDGLFPKFFDEDPVFPRNESDIAYFIAALMMRAGLDDQARKLTGPLAERMEKRTAAYGLTSFDIFHHAAMGDRETVRRQLREFNELGRYPELWPVRFRRAGVLDFVREEPEYQELVQKFEQRAAEQRAVLAGLTGTDTKKRGPT